MEGIGGTYLEEFYNVLVVRLGGQALERIL
jgi:hypothetical protein